MQNQRDCPLLFLKICADISQEQAKENDGGTVKTYILFYLKSRAKLEASLHLIYKEISSLNAECFH